MEIKAFRKLSWDKVSAYGLPTNQNLPGLEEVRIERTKSQVVKRLMCLLASAAVSYGFSRVKAKEWIEKEELTNAMEEPEIIFINKGKGHVDVFKKQIEGMWALSWALSIIQDIDFNKNCPNNFVTMLPDLKQMEPITNISSNTTLRAEIEIIQTADFLYCLNWAIKQAELEGKKTPLKIEPYVVLERRKAIEWLLSKENWYDISLDT